MTSNKQVAIDIESVSQYLEKIKETISQNAIGSNIYFRGEKKCYPNTKALLFRGDKGDNKLINVDDELSLYHDAQTFYPYIFRDCHTALDRLVKMQHYGLPTRLLDVTSNPLVALYFACEDYNMDDKKEGRVLYVNDKTLSSIETVKLMAELAFVEVISPFSIKEVLFALKGKPTILDKYDDNLKKAKFLFENDILTKPYLFQSPMNNDRIIAQSGAFVCCPFAHLHVGFKDMAEEIKFKDNVLLEDYYKLDFDKTTSCMDGFFSKYFFKISPSCKERIIEELDQYGINKAVIYPDPEHQMQHITERQIRLKKKDEEDIIKPSVVADL